jgi:hypothetical protein
MPQIHYPEIFFVFIFCLFTLYFLLDNVSERVSLLGLYHKLDSRDLFVDRVTLVFGVQVIVPPPAEGPEKQTCCTGYALNSLKGIVYTIILKDNRDPTKTDELLYEKIAKIGRVYAWLSFLLIVCFYVILTNQIFIFNIDTSGAYLLSITLSLSTLFVVRLLSNPKEEPKISDHYIEDNVRSEILEIHRERILSFLYSFIATNVFLAVIIMGYTIYNFNTIIQNTDTDSLSKLLTTFLHNFSLEYLAYWIALLFLCSIIGEIILTSVNPKHKADRVST